MHPFAILITVILVTGAVWLVATRIVAALTDDPAAMLPKGRSSAPDSDPAEHTYW
jgi:hypothetical protein